MNKIKIIFFMAMFLSLNLIDANDYFATCENCCGQFLIKKTLEENNILRNDDYYFNLFGGDVVTYINEIREKLESEGIKTTKIGNNMNPNKARKYLNNGYYIIGLKQRHWWLITEISNNTYKTYDINLDVSYQNIHYFITTDNLAVKITKKSQ